MRHQVIYLIAALIVISILAVPTHGFQKIDKNDRTMVCSNGCLSPKLKTKEKLVKSVLVLPAQVEMTKQGVKGSEGMAREAEEVSVKLREAVAKALEQKGLKLASSTMNDKTLNEDSELRAAVSSVQKRYDTVAIQLKKKPKDVNKGRFTLGDEVGSFTPAASSDALVFIRARGGQETKGKAFLTGGGLLGMALAGTYIQFSISLVDSQTGAVLYTAGSFVRLKDNDLPKGMAKSLSRMFKKLPSGS